MPRRLRQVVPIALREPQEKLRVTDNVRNKQRITEEPVKRKQKRFATTMLATMVVPMLLLALLLVPHALGFSLLPAGFPLLGAPPVASVSIVTKSKMLQDRYLLTASPRVKTPDLTTHTIPDRQIQSSATDNRTVQTTGTRSIPGVQAHGTVVFVNSTNIPILVPAQFSLATPAGVHIQTTTAATVPPEDGKVFVPALAVDPGAAGNISAHSLDGTISNGLSVQNPAPFSGGVDAQMVHVVDQADIDGVQSSLTPQLEQQIIQHLRSQVKANEVMTGEPAYKTTISPSSPVGAQLDQLQVTITISGEVTVYDRNVVNHTAAQLLSKEAVQTLDNNYQLHGTLTIATPRVEAPAKNGLVYLSVSVHGLWVYTLTSQQTSRWLQLIKGATSAAALAYLNEQPGVAAVQIHLPFAADHLPSSIDDIKIILVTNASTS
jgi:hypothetical protein